MTMQKSDKPESGLDQELRDLHAVLPSESPSDLVDQRVLNHARRALDDDKNPATRHGTRPWSFGWVHGLTTAGVMVFAATLLINLQQPVSPERAVAPSPPPERAPAARTREERADSAVAPVSADRLQAAPGQPTVVQESFSDKASKESSGASVRMSQQVSATAEAKSEALSPEVWVERIRDLVRDGDQEAAQREIAAFRAAWPDHPLPADLDDGG